ncbi:ATP-binding protein [Nostoc sp. LEGE 12447]|uniref:P-loop NTPase fold protein n=1 Tax=Nostoc sp. LEGE 12447 TaxID=1828640 RepID=UPI0018833B97|nr:P-loop NTPase fold protein [Nostoc sp. LEGE 12447]MBE9000338.1 ATP-binding protein [Nostoc sp. LEGE 12447]
MTIDLRKFYKATDPGKTLAVANPEDRKYYIDFSSVRGGEIIEELKYNITFLSPDDPTCFLFTGHIGCGKSTELLRLNKELEEEGFHVVYFESSEDLEMEDVDIVDVLLAIAYRVSQSLDKIVLEEPSKLNKLLQGVWNVLNSEVTGLKVKPPEMPGLLKLGDLGFTSENQKLTIAFGFGEIITRVKNDENLREKLNQHLGPKKTELLEAINKELLEPAIAKLKLQGKKGLVVIVDNLDRIDSRPKPWGRPQQEYLFVDQGESLSKLNCHVLYTMPLALKFSNEYGNLTQRFSEEPKVLPMVVVQQDGSDYEPGIALLRQMVLARAFPDLDEKQRLEKISEIFDSPKTLDQLCRVSGGHVRDLLRLLNTWIQKERKFPPLSRQTLEDVIRSRFNEMTITIYDDDWELLRKVKQQKKVSGDQGYQKLIRSRLVFEYRISNLLWFDINPILADAKELQP